MATGYAQNGLVEKALKAFRQMQLVDVNPDSTAFANILPACAKMGALEQGDVCIFEGVDDSENEIKINVHIFPVVEERSPYKYIKGGQGNDSLSSTTKLCKKGNFVEDRMEQLQGEKENPGNGSKCINLDKPKCKPFISERKAGCRRSLRLTQSCHLTKCPKKELWDDKNVVILS